MILFFLFVGNFSHFVRRLLGPQFANNGKDVITVRNCLLHNAGACLSLSLSLSLSLYFHRALFSLCLLQDIPPTPRQGIGRRLLDVRSLNNITLKKAHSMDTHIQRTHTQREHIHTERTHTHTHTHTFLCLQFLIAFLFSLQIFHVVSEFISLFSTKLCRSLSLIFFSSLSHFSSLISLTLYYSVPLSLSLSWIVCSTLWARSMCTATSHSSLSCTSSGSWRRL